MALISSSTLLVRLDKGLQEAKDLNESGSGDKVWVIGVDRDQDADGKYKTKDGKEDNFTLTSTLKGVGTAVQDIANRALEDKFLVANI